VSFKSLPGPQKVGMLPSCRCCCRAETKLSPCLAAKLCPGRTPPAVASKQAATRSFKRPCTLSIQINTEMSLTHYLMPPGLFEKGVCLLTCAGDSNGAGKVCKTARQDLCGCWKHRKQAAGNINDCPGCIQQHCVPSGAQHAADPIREAQRSHVCGGSCPQIIISMAHGPWPSSSTKAMHSASRAPSQQTAAFPCVLST